MDRARVNVPSCILRPNPAQIHSARKSVGGGPDTARSTSQQGLTCKNAMGTIYSRVGAAVANACIPCGNPSFSLAVEFLNPKRAPVLGMQDTVSVGICSDGPMRPGLT